MGTSLTGKQIKNTYKSLIKVSDNTEASASAKQLSDGNGNDFGVYIDTDGVLGLGSAPSYSLDISSRTDGVALPVGTTANRPTASAGLLRYNSTIGKVEFYDTGWKTIYTTSGGTIDGNVTVTGDLVVQGTTVTLNTETVQFEDNILMLNRASNDTQYSATNAGIELEKTSATNPSFLYTYSDSTWTATDNFKIEGNLTVDTNTLYVDSADNRVGIGTLDPQVNLQVEGTIMNYRSRYSTNQGTSYWDIRRDSSTGNFVISDDGLGDVIEISQTNGNVAFDTNTLYVDSTNNRVGIGTLTPNKPLTIIANDDYQLRLATTDNAYSSAGIFLGEDISDPNYFGTIKWEQSSVSMKISSKHGNATGGMIFETGVSSVTEKMRIHSTGDISFRDGSANEAFYWDASTGRLSIGAGSAPSAKLTVKDSQDSSFDSGIGIVRSTSSQTGYISMVGGAFNFNAPSGVPIKFRDGGTTNVTINGSGNVGIGTDSPQENFSIYETNYPAIHFTNSHTGTTSTDGITVLLDGSTKDFIVRQREAGNIRWFTNNTERMRITSGGVVEVRNTAPTFKLANTDTSIFTGQTIGEFVFTSDDAAPTGANVANIKVAAVNNFSVNSTGTDMIFSTCSSTSQTASERARILSGGGITFNGDTAAANALDDYEEGTFTATLVPATSGTITLNSTYATWSYTKIGRMVTVNGVAVVSSVSSPVGAFIMMPNLPFTILNQYYSYGGVTCTLSDASAGYAKSSIGSWHSIGNTNLAFGIDASTIGGNDEFYVTATYFV